MIPLCSPGALRDLHHIKVNHLFRTAQIQTCCRCPVRLLFYYYYLLSFLEQTIKGSSTQYCSVNDLAWVFSCGFSTQNGQTAQKVAEGASHQDIIDLLKAHAEASSTADLLWARLTTFTSCHHDLFILQLFCLSSGKNGAVRDTRLSQCGHFPPLHICQHALRVSICCISHSQYKGHQSDWWWDSVILMNTALQRRWGESSDGWTLCWMKRSSKSSSSKYKHMIYLSDIQDEIWQDFYFLFYDTSVIFIHFDEMLYVECCIRL